MCMSLGKTPSQTKFGNKQGDWLKTAWKANPITLKPETAGCMAERLSWPSLPYLLSAKVPLPNSLLLCQYVWLHSSFLSVRQELSLVVSEKAMAPHSSTLAWKIPWMEEPDRLQSMGSWSRTCTERLHFHALEKEMATHSSVLAWRIPGTGEPGRLPSLGLHRVGHDWSDAAAAVIKWFQQVTAKSYLRMNFEWK